MHIFMGLSSRWQALPTQVNDSSAAQARGAQSVVWREGEELCLRLSTRKNLPCGSGVLRRACSCHGSFLQICPIHVLWDTFLGGLVGQKPWASSRPATVRSQLRSTLAKLGVPMAGHYGTHDFRRGHAKVGEHLTPACCK